MKKQSVLFLAQAAVIAALYAVLTILQNILLPGTASLAIQFRVSEVLTVLAIFTPAAIPGLTVGCFVANLSSLPSLGPVDLIFGTLASFTAAILMYALRNVRFFKLPILSALMPVTVAVVPSSFGVYITPLTVMGAVSACAWFMVMGIMANTISMVTRIANRLVLFFVIISRPPFLF